MLKMLEIPRFKAKKGLILCKINSIIHIHFRIIMDQKCYDMYYYGLAMLNKYTLFPYYFNDESDVYFVLGYI